MKCSRTGKNVCFCIPTLQLDRSGDKQGSLGKCRSNDTSDTHMADTTLVYSPTKNVHTTTITFTSPRKPITKSPGRKTSSCENQVPKVSGVKNYRKTLSPCPEDQVKLQVTNRPGASGLAGIVDKKLTQFVRL